MLVAGLDEAGRGSLISRVYTAIVILPDNFLDLCQEEKIIIRDSKKMTKRQRKKVENLLKNMQLIIMFNLVNIMKSIK